jgi:hypothetical protein
MTSDHGGVRAVGGFSHTEEFRGILGAVSLSCYGDGEVPVISVKLWSRNLLRNEQSAPESRRLFILPKHATLDPFSA